jgi:transcriptional regulator with XRE-family HTH domain
MPEDVKKFLYLPFNDDRMSGTQQTAGQRIRAARERLKMKQIELARAVGVSSVSASDWERDVYSPSDENWDKLEEVLGISRSELEHGFGSSTQDTFNAGVREGLRRAVDAVQRLALEVVTRPANPTDVPIVPVERVEPAGGTGTKRRAKE